MSAELRIGGPDGQLIRSVEEWLEHAPPAGGAGQWRTGYSAKEQARAWLRDGEPAVPHEIASALADLGLDAHDIQRAFPEHETELDDFPPRGRGRRNHDMLALLGDPDRPSAVVGVEAKACENFDGLVLDRGYAEPPSNKRARCNLMAKALFGRPVFDDATGTVVDEDLASHGYQLWTGAVGTLIEAQAHNAAEAVFVVQQFVPGLERVPPDDARPWARRLAGNREQLGQFKHALGELPAHAQETAFVAAGTRLHVLKVESLMPPEPESQREAS